MGSVTLQRICPARPQKNVNNSIAASWNLEKNFLPPFFSGLSKKCHLAKRLVSLLCLPDSGPATVH